MHILTVIFLLLGLLGAAGCATTETIPVDTVIAVWDVENLNPVSEQSPQLGEFLAARVMQTFKDTGRYTVVERQRLQVVLEELALGSAGLADEASRLQLGRLLGARYMVFGGYFVVEQTMRLDLRLVNVETGAVVRAAKQMRQSADLAGWLDAADQAALDLI